MNISCKDRHNKGKKSKDITEAEEIKKRWQEYKEELYQKGLNDQDNRDDVAMDCSPPGSSVRLAIYKERKDVSVVM